MRDYLLLYINGHEHRIKGQDAFLPLSSYLRYEKMACGTKVVCEEGDCGACTIILGKLVDGEIVYRPVNSCIQFMYQLDLSHVVTVEGLNYSGELNPVQSAMVDCHGAQCGYCTPGFITALCSIFENRCHKEKAPVSAQDIKDGLTGNLCRCTGYESIIEAGLAVDPASVLSLAKLYPSAQMIATLSEHAHSDILIETEYHSFFAPTRLEKAINYKAQHKGTVIIAGGTDVCVYWNKRGIKPTNLMSFSNLPGFNELQLDETKQAIEVGARTTLSELESFIGEHVPQFKEILWLFGSPQIRNAGTLVGNIANGSPIADSLPFLFVTGAEVELAGLNGKRRVAVSKFYKGYKKLDLAPDEVITKVVIPLPRPGEILKLYKVSKRKHLDISAFTAAILMAVETKTAENGKLKGQKPAKSAATIKSVSIAYGGVGPVVLRLPRTESFLTGKEFVAETFVEAGKLAREEITPISDVRGSSDFRFTLAANVPIKFFHEVQGKEKTPCLQ